jgi:hypothetical protein
MQASFRLRLDTNATEKERTLRRLGLNLMLALLCGGALTNPASSQGLTGDKAVESIVGDSAIRQEEATTSAEEQKVLAAIDKTVENTSTVRKLSAAKRVDIVFLADAARAQGVPSPKIERKLKDHANEITVLRQELEANALLFHAVDSRRVMTKDILAVDFPDPDSVVVYAAGKPAN